MKYEVIICWAEECNVFLAEVPELLGCMADGTTEQKALSEVEIIADEWIETARLLGRPIPVPRGKLMYA